MMSLRPVWATQSDDDSKIKGKKNAKVTKENTTSSNTEIQKFIEDYTQEEMEKDAVMYD